MAQPITEQTARELIRKIERLINLTTGPVAESKKWVKVTTITDLTGWDGQRLRRARDNGEIEWKKDNNGGFWYNPSSLNPVHIKLKATA